MALSSFVKVSEAAAWAESIRSSGRRLALVPTMGFLHEGHLSLMREARVRADAVAVSIFVNPTQFGPKEDLSRYPRDPEGDRFKCESVPVDAIFSPEPSEMYPAGAQTVVEVQDVSRGLCGEKRPGHFRGVATVVTKLFAIFRPHLALFGQKDFQQLKVIEALSRDLNLGVEVLGLPTVREADGLAMSSRNAYLNPEDRQRALALSRGMHAAEALLKTGVRGVRDLVTVARRELEQAGVREDYVEIVDAQTLKGITRVNPGEPARILIAGFVGNTRLIDNQAL
jgi:pantoate--beta-alanine ligase